MLDRPVIRADVADAQRGDARLRTELRHDLLRRTKAGRLHGASLGIVRSQVDKALGTPSAHGEAWACNTSRGRCSSWTTTTRRAPRSIRASKNMFSGGGTPEAPGGQLRPASGTSLARCDLASEGP